MSKYYVFVLATSIFVFGAVLGWCIELLFRRFISRKKWVNPGLLTGPYLPIYGFGTLFLFIASYFDEYIIGSDLTLGLFKLFFVSSIFMTLMELISGLFFLKYFKLRLWNYSDERLNYKGVICLRFSIIWGLSSLIYYFFINPYLTKLFSYYIDNIYLSFFVGIIFGFILLDAWLTFEVTAKIRKFAKEAEEVIHYEEFKEAALAARKEYEEKRNKFFFIPHKEHVKERIEQLLNKKNNN